MIPGPHLKTIVAEMAGASMNRPEAMAKHGGRGPEKPITYIYFKVPMSSQLPEAIKISGAI